MKYVFLSINTKPACLLFITGFFILVIIPWLFITQYVYLGIIVLITLTLGYIFTNVGVIHKTASSQLLIKTLGSKDYLTSSLSVRRWWSYLFEVVDIKELQSGMSGNDLGVFLDVIDSTNRRIIFVEYIGFGSRFPNECRHDIVPVSSDVKIIGVQRTDKLYQFLQRAGMMDNLTPQKTHVHTDHHHQ